MQVFTDKNELQIWLQPKRVKGQKVGLVPTMGALHEGHLSLVRKAHAENDVVVVSIFVNPTQFNNADDLTNYPSDLDGDLKQLASVSEDLVVFTPSKEHIYEGSITSNAYNFNGLEQVMEGSFRPGHFNGVATIVSLLFKAVLPDNAYFGEKDYQQLMIIKRLVQEEAIEVAIIPCAIEREKNGLAMSSRNQRLSLETRKEAGFIYETLKTAKGKFGTENAILIEDWVRRQFNRNALFELEYFQIADANTLAPIEEIENDKKYRAFVAVYAEGVRLIDNIALN